MAGKDAQQDQLLNTTWVHVFEEDSPEGAVYRPEEDDIPLSRRPRKRLRLEPNGAARVLIPGPDDRYVEQPAKWSEEKGDVVIRPSTGEPSLRIVSQSPSRLIVRAQHSSGS
jgi:hypothetical protein